MEKNLNREQWLERMHQAKVRKQECLEEIKADLSDSFERQHGEKPTYFFVM